MDAGTHEKISTGRKHDKFGIPYQDAPGLYRLAADMAGIEPVGVHLHIGSQIGRLEPFEAAYRRGAELFTSLRAEGIPLRRLDLGGGFGVRYLNEPRVEAEPSARWSDGSPPGSTASSCSSPVAPSSPRRVSFCPR